MADQKITELDLIPALATDDVLPIVDDTGGTPITKKVAISQLDTRYGLDASKQPVDSDLTTIAGLSPTDDDILQRKAGAWTNRTMAQLKTDLALAKADVGLGNVDNTSDSTKNSASVTLTNKTINATNNSISNLTTAMFASNVVDTDVSLTANSDTRIPSQKAIKAYVDSAVGGGVSDGDKGDVTVSSGVWTIDNSAITLSKMENMAPASFIGRNTASTGVPEALSVSTTKSILHLNNVSNTSDQTKNSASATLTNKRITSRIGTTTSSSTPTPTGDSSDQYNVTALAAGATFAAPSGTPTDGQKLIIRIKDNGTAGTLAWNAIYRASSDLALPTTTVISKTMYLGFVYNSADTKWDLIALLNNF